MAQPRPKVLAISALRASPVRVNLHTEHLIESIRGSVEGGMAAPGITVALVGKSQYYIVDGHARVQAYKKAELEEVNVAEVLDLKNETEVLVEHVRRNLRSHMNPIRVAEAAAHLAKAGAQDPFKLLGVSPVMETAVNVINRWPTDVRTTLSRLLDTSAGKFSDVYAPPHFFVAFEELTDRAHRGDESAEIRLKDIVSHIVQYLGSISEETEFCLPGPDQVYALMSSRRQALAGEATAFAEGLPAVRASCRERLEGGYEEPDSEEYGDQVGYREPLMMPDRNKSLIECTHCGRPQVVDLKTGHACPVESVAGGMIDVIRDGDGLRSYSLSMKAMRFLGLDRPVEEVTPDSCTVLATDKKSEVERLLKSAKPTAHFVVIMSQHGWEGGR
jgi:hypothetical protein